MGTARFVPLPLIIMLFMVVSASGEWVDYPSGIRSNIPAESCDPWSPDANAACRDICHYGGCKKGGHCEEADFGTGRFCHCDC